MKADFYVAPNGNDEGAGTLADPFSTITRARDAVRSRMQSDVARDYVVLLHGGYYRLSDTVVFGLQDSAPKGHTVTYRACPGERPVLGSGVPIVNWKKWKGNIWQAPAPEGIEFCTTLFQGEAMLHRARSESFVPRPTTDRRYEFGFPEGLVPADAVARGLYLRIIPRPWSMNLLPIARVDPARSVARTGSPCSYPMVRPRIGHYPDGTAWIENAVEDADSPGDWASDAESRQIYLWSDGERPPSGIVAPGLTELVRVEGEIDYGGSSDTPVRGLVFEGLTFMHADHWQWEADRRGWGLQHDWEMFDRPTALLRFRGAEDCAARQCEFTASGGAAIRCDLHAQKIRIERNHIHHIGGVGVLLAGYGPGTKDVNHHNAVLNNHIHNVGRVLWHAAGIFAWQSGSNRIAHNHVHDMPYCAVVVSGRIIWSRVNHRECARTIRWTEVDAALDYAGEGRPPWKLREPFLHGRRNTVEYNDIHHCMRIQADGNAIYISGTGDANQIRHNYIHDVDSANMNAAIRCDDDQHATIMHGNIIADCAGEGFIIKGANTISNNIVYGLRTTGIDGRQCHLRRGYLVLRTADCTGAVVARNIFYATETDTPVLTEHPEAEAEGPALLRQCRADGNLYFNAADPQWGERHLEAQRTYGIEQQSVAADPMFADPAQGDFTLLPESPALRLGFTPIYQELIGPRRHGLEEDE